MCEDATQVALPMTPRDTIPSGPAQTVVCTTRNPMPSHAQVCRRRAEVIVSSTPLAATYQVE